MAETTATVTSSCRAKTSVRSRSNLSAQMCATRHRINQLPCDAHLSPPPCVRPLKDIAHAKPAPDFLDIDGPAFEGEARIASDYEQRECRDDLLNHSIREVFLFRVAAHVLE